MTDYFTIPQGRDLVLLIVAIAAYALYWTVFRSKIRAYLRRGQDDSQDLGT
jgi:hypothetical protein